MLNFNANSDFIKQRTMGYRFMWLKETSKEVKQAVVYLTDALQS